MKIPWLLGALLLTSPLSCAWAQGHPVSVPGLTAPAQLTRDTDGVTHVLAKKETDVWFLQGYLHARDRLFQMDEFRRTASGTLAELLGPPALASDVQLRTIGLRRAAVRTLAALLPETRAALDAYVRGVNAYVASHPLPPEFGVLKITKFAPWTALDSVVIGKLFAAQLSLEFDIDTTVALQSYLQAGTAAGFDGNALFFDDLDRAQPFDSASTIPDAMQARRTGSGGHRYALGTPDPSAGALGRRWLDSISRIPALAPMLQPHKRPGSNLWAVSASLSASGRPMIANDRHLQLSTPPVWYPIGLEVPGRLEVFGVSFAGTPAVLGGYNRHIAWGSTNTLFDVTDTYQEQVVPDSTSPSGLSTLYKGRPEWVIPIPEVYRANQITSGQSDNVVVVPPGGAIPAATLIVPRRNNGPIVQLDPSTGVALSLQWVGFSATREFDAILRFATADTLDDFKSALQYFDVGSQNWVVGDDRGNIAYYSSGEVPVREDLQAGYINGVPPNFIRNGQGGNEWMAVTHPQPNQTLPFEVLPFAELPQIVNPPAGFFVNANNDPVGVTLDNNPFNQMRPGGGIYYLSYTFDDPSGVRAGEITHRLRALLATPGRRISFEDMQSIQADVVLRDAEFFAPYVTAAYDHAMAPGANPLLKALAGRPGVAEAVDRLRRWDYTSPSGLTEGWDAGKPAGTVPSAASIDSSVATTVYTLWRSRFIANTIDSVIGGAGLPVPDSTHALIALRNLLENFATRGGRGNSGVDFFPQPSAVTSPTDRRDFVLLQSVDEALARLSSNDLAPAYGNSTRQSDYRWGKLHRIVFASDLGAPFSIPPAGGAFPSPLPGLDGIPTDGGANTVDAASFDPRGSGLNDFMFSHGPSQRFVAQVAPGATTRAEDIWPGGTSGVLGSPWYAQFLTRWLTNQAVPLHLDQGEVRGNAAEVQLLLP